MALVDLRKATFDAHLEIPIIANYLKCCTLRCLHEIRHDSIAIYTLSMHQLATEWIAS